MLHCGAGADYSKAGQEMTKPSLGGPVTSFSGRKDSAKLSQRDDEHGSHSIHLTP